MSAITIYIVVMSQSEASATGIKPSTQRNEEKALKGCYRLLKNSQAFHEKNVMCLVNATLIALYHEHQFDVIKVDVLLKFFEIVLKQFYILHKPNGDKGPNCTIYLSLRHRREQSSG